MPGYGYAQAPKEVNADWQGRMFDYLRGRHTVLRKELFAHRRELVLWTSWGLLISSVNVAIVWYGGYLTVTGRASVGDIMAFQWYAFLLLGPPPPTAEASPAE